MNTLWDIEQIKQLKARYFHFLDDKNWGDLATCLSMDVSFSYPPQSIELKGREAVINNLSTRHAATKTAHTGSMPEIIVQDAYNATGIWFMSDVVISDNNGTKETKKGYGRYHETYIRQEDQWLINSILLERILFE